MVIMCDEDHMIGVDGAERGKAIANDTKEGDEYAVDNVDNVDLATTDVDPTDQEEHPSQTK